MALFHGLVSRRLGPIWENTLADGCKLPSDFMAQIFGGKSADKRREVRVWDKTVLQHRAQTVATENSELGCASVCEKCMSIFPFLSPIVPGLHAHIETQKGVVFFSHTMTLTTLVKALGGFITFFEMTRFTLQHPGSRSSRYLGWSRCDPLQKCLVSGVGCRPFGSWFQMHLHASCQPEG